MPIYVKRKITHGDLDLNSIADPNSHASRHAYGGADPIPDDGLRMRQVRIAFGAEQGVDVGAGSTAVISEGVWIVRLGPNTKVEYSPDGGTTWYELIGAGGTGIVFSDGSNVRLNNGGTGSETSYLLPIE